MLLWYATHFRKHSVQKTGFSGTGVIFGTGNPLLWYAMHFQGPRARGSPLCTEYARGAKRPPVVRGAFSGALGAKKGLLWYATRFQVPPVRR